MDQVSAIFSQLGANDTVIIQFVIVILMFILCKFIFLNKLQFIIENREEKTTKLEASADDLFEKASKLSDKYKQRIDEAHLKAQKIILDKKAEVLEIERQKMKKAEEEVNNYVESSKSKITNEIATKKAEILSEAGHLSDLLINKLSGKK